MVMNKNVWVHGHDQRSWTAIIEFVTLLKTYMLEEHGYIQRSAFIYCNDLSGLYNLPATPKISTTTSLRTSLNQPTECTTPHFWSGQSVCNSTLRSLGSEEQEEEQATSFSLRRTLLGPLTLLCWWTAVTGPGGEKRRTQRWGSSYVVSLGGYIVQ